MKVSIITPCYNSASYIKNTIASVQSQTISDWEMIVVDDGSTDNSAEIIQQISLLDNRIKLVQKANGGSASARNLGLSIAQGEYIQFLDADDTIAHDKLEHQIPFMETEGLDVSYTDFRMTNPDGTVDENLMGHTFNLSKLLIGWGPLGTIPPHTFLYKHDFLKKHKISFTTEIREREDWDFHIKIFSARPRVKRIIGYCGAYYFRCPTGKTSDGDLEKIRRGNLRFLTYKIHKLHGYKRLALLIRLSTELWFLLLSTIKYQIWGQLRLLNTFKQSWRTRLQLISAIVLLPIAMAVIIIYLINTRLR